ncbi:MAG: hypothetical protein DHS20C02_07690 [Micavibrio sp.]|nr:MAG: hypothetical protein DHS20C02_07690 [Micavibrio sp.]
MSEGNNPRDTEKSNTADVFGDAVQIKRYEPKPVHLALAIDITASRENSIESAQTDFAKQMRDLKQTIESVSSIENLTITLVTYKGNTVSYEGTFKDPEKVSEAFSALKCEKGCTQICQSLDVLKKIDEHKMYDPINAVLVIGDTVDSGRVKAKTRVKLRKKYPGFAPDTLKYLELAGRNFGAPIITLVEETGGTDPWDYEAFKKLSESSGIQGCPLEWDAEIKFKDYVAATAAMAAGPEAVKEMADKVDPKVWLKMSPKTARTINKPVFIKEVIKEKEPWLKMLGAGVTGFALGTMLSIGSCDPIIIKQLPPVKPDKVCGLKATFDHVKSDIYFKHDSYQILKDATYKLDMLGCFLEQNPNHTLILKGGASTNGGRDHNRNLSWERAQTVELYVRRNFNIGNYRIILRGFGENNPVHLPDGPENIAEHNRYVQMDFD